MTSPAGFSLGSATQVSAAHDLSGKTLIRFITHGGYGLGDSQTVIARHALRAQLRGGFSMQADQERQTMDRVNRWLDEVPALRAPR